MTNKNEVDFIEVKRAIREREKKKSGSENFFA